MNLKTHLQIIGLIVFGLSLLHFFFPKRFQWREEFGRVSLINRQMFYVHTFFLVLVLVFMAALNLFHADLLLERSKLAGLLLWGQALFWMLRLWVQWFVYDRSLWRGDRFNTFVHWVFTLFWAYFSAIYILAGLQ